MSRSIRIHHGAAFAAAAALAAAMLPGLAAAQVPSSQVPDELKVVIQQYIEDQGHEFAGFCDDVNANPDGATPGTYCAMVGSIEHEIAEVFYGPVFSDEISMVSFHFENGEWTLTGSGH